MSQGGAVELAEGRCRGDNLSRRGSTGINHFDINDIERIIQERRESEFRHILRNKIGIELLEPVPNYARIGQRLVDVGIDKGTRQLFFEWLPGALKKVKEILCVK